MKVAIYAGRVNRRSERGEDTRSLWRMDVRRCTGDSLRETAASGGVYEVILEDLVAVVYESDATSPSSGTCPRAPRAALREDT